jgi:predicted  nucleic acid-binding Zn-ribbon protein
VSLAELEALLVVQEHDTALDRLRHRRETLPERAQLESQLAEQRRAQGARAAVQGQRDEVHATERRLDDETRAIQSHADDVNKKLYSGTVTSPRELQAMQADIEMLRRQISDLEDEELEVMEQRETLDAQLATIDSALTALDESIGKLRETIDRTEREIDEEMAIESAGRAEAAAPIPESLTRDYEKRRAQNRGAGAARLVGTTCQACHLTIPSTEAEQIRRAAGNEVAYCDNCGAILVP